LAESFHPLLISKRRARVITRIMIVSGMLQHYAFHNVSNVFTGIVGFF
jgi:hypothetical protein